MSSKLIEAKRLEAFGFKLIPLNSNPEDKFYRKRPRDSRWMAAKYSEEDVNKSFARNKAIGARVPKGYLVIDVDVRDGKPGLDSIMKLPQESLYSGSFVTTGSGGLHIIFKLPEGIEKVDAGIESLPGIDFRCYGTQIVAPGSINADGNPYVWSSDVEDMDVVTIPDIPKDIWTFLHARQREHVQAAFKAGSEPAWDPHELETFLNHLNIEDYREHDAWFKVMCAAHEATAGIGLDVFFRWCDSDPNPANRISMQELEKRWKSFDSNKAGGITRRYLETLIPAEAVAQHDFGVEELNRRGAPVKYLLPDEPKLSEGFTRVSPELANAIERVGMEVFDADSGALTTVGGFDPADFDEDFDDRGLVETLDSERLKDPLSRLNEKYAVVPVGGTIRIASSSVSIHGQLRWNYYRLADFTLLLGNQRIEEAVGNKVVTIPLADAWLKWSGRRQYQTRDFLPTHAGPSEYVKYVEGLSPSVFNSFTGWPVTPRFNPSLDTDSYELPASCANFQRLLWEGLSSQHEEAYKYIIDWLSWSFYNPDEPIGVVLCFRGKKGIGKGMFGNILNALVGDYFWMTANMKQVMGDFNGNLATTVFLALDEALWSGDKRQVRQFQNLVTEEYISTTIKGLQPEKSRNCLHITIFTNEEWAAPVGGDDERRYAVLDASDALKHNGQFWLDLRKEYIKGDSERTTRERKQRLGDLLGWFIQRGKALTERGWQANKNIPQTRALKEQRIQAAEPIEVWWLEEFLDFGAVGIRDIHEEVKTEIEALKAKALGVDNLDFADERELEVVLHSSQFRSLLKTSKISIWAPELNDSFTNSDNGAVWRKSSASSYRALSVSIGQFLAREVPSLERVKRTVPTKDRERIPCSSTKFQAYAYEFPLEYFGIKFGLL